MNSRFAESPPSIARSSAAMALIVEGKWVLDSHKKGHKLPMPSQGCKMMKCQLHIYQFPRFKIQDSNTFIHQNYMISTWIDTLALVMNNCRILSMSPSYNS